jgi:OmpA-OmpF porin, OOP family
MMELKYENGRCTNLKLFRWGRLAIMMWLGVVKPGLSQTPDPFKLVNSVYDEQNPLIAPDGKTMYVTVANHPQNIGGKRDLGDIWVSSQVDGVWQKAVHGGNEINDSNYNSVAGFSADGSTMFLLGHYKKRGMVTTQGLAYSKKFGNGWSAPENIMIPYFLNRSATISGDITDDGTVFVFSAESYSTRGSEDIYVSIKRGERWGEPFSISNQINTPFQEICPTLSADTRTLYFASNGLGGLGSFDLFSCNRLDDTWKNWSQPVNLGESINSGWRELYYRISQGNRLYTTTHDSDGYGDIRLALNANLLTDSLVKIGPRQDDPISSNKIIIQGNVTNSKSGEPIAAKLRFKADSVYSTASSPDGHYEIQIPSTKTYTIEVENQGFVNLLEKLDVQSMKLNTLEMNFKLQPVEVGTLVSLKSVLFYMGTTTLLQESYVELDAVIDFLKANPKVEIELEGHTDNRGDAKKNLKLSQERVAAIKSYMVSKGISSRRIKGKGFGGSRPVANSDSEEARKINRRVEFLIVKN